MCAFDHCHRSRAQDSPPTCCLHKETSYKRQKAVKCGFKKLALPLICSLTKTNKNTRKNIKQPHTKGRGLRFINWMVRSPLGTVSVLGHLLRESGEAFPLPCASALCLLCRTHGRNSWQRNQPRDQILVARRGNAS